MLFFFSDTATTEICTLSLHDALPISASLSPSRDPRPDTDSSTSATFSPPRPRAVSRVDRRVRCPSDRKSTRLNSSHANISYAVFCLKKKKHDSYPYPHPDTSQGHFLL